MMLYFDEEGTAQKVDEENTVLVDEKELEDFINKFNEQGETIERLKRTMKDVAELLSTEADLFSDKATEHDINAYIELKEFDNKDAYYMAVSIKKAIKMLKGDVDD